MPPILVARRAGIPERDRAWDHVHAWWTTHAPDWPMIVELDTGSGLFNKSAALNRAARAAGDWDLAVLIDADILPATIEQVRRAVARAARRGRLTFAHDRRVALTGHATLQVLAGADPAALECEADDPNTFSSLSVIPRALWDAVGGFDERFDGWGGEDIAFMSACLSLAGIDRVGGDIFHLWHPTDGHDTHARYPDNEALMFRYLAVKGDRAGTLALLEERTQ